MEYLLIGLNHFSGIPGNVLGLSLVPILFYPGRFPFCLLTLSVPTEY
jgi:hypothetical protein